MRKSNWIIFPIFGVKIKHIWNHHHHLVTNVLEWDEWGKTKAMKKNIHQDETLLQFEMKPVHNDLMNVVERKPSWISFRMEKSKGQKGRIPFTHFFWRIWCDVWRIWMNLYLKFQAVFVVSQSGLQIWPAKAWKPIFRSLSMICGFVCQDV